LIVRNPDHLFLLKETAEEFLGEIERLIALAEAGFPQEHPFAQVRVIPQDVPLPPLWILGSSDKGAGIAAKLGVGFAYANHFKSDMLFDALDLYRENFQPSLWLQSPRAIGGASSFGK
jgi:alkanesulfonate monooxygenase SsuD/methylene tetrahydromethanopterin reductase-like flavin-dependent oxidoreductase (luciferase family)